ncbi:4-aminobutyrate--2-oxoglutarate transaminase, partial [Staphylococcus equorum]
TGLPDKALTGKITQTANDKGLLLLSAGIKGNVIRFLPPLVITDEELNQGLNILTHVFDEVTSNYSVS